MTVEQMREAVRRVYSGEKWDTKVSRMSESQVVAVYWRFKANNKL